MTRRRRVAGVAIVAVATLLLSQAPAMARWHREAREGVNVLQVCPRYVTLQVASIGPDGSTPPTFRVPIRAFSPPPTPTSLPPPRGDLVLRRGVDLPRDPQDIVLDNDSEPTHFDYFGSFTLRWKNGQRLAPGTQVAIGVADTFVPGSESAGEFETFTVPFAESGSCSRRPSASAPGAGQAQQ